MELLKASQNLKKRRATHNSLKKVFTQEKQLVEEKVSEI